MTRPLPFLLLAASLSAQSAQTSARPAQPEDFGTVTGHITCTDTQRPARLAEVRLVPATPPAALHSANDAPSADENIALGSRLAPVETDMSGAFHIRNMRPGQYYLRVDYPGYITPLLSFTRDQLVKPDIEVKQRIDQQLQLISVSPHATTQADAVVNRGAAISGAVTYDDGSPGIGITVVLLRRNAKGEFKDAYQPSRYIPPTDDHGRYRVDALPAGDYVVKADLSMSEHTVSSMPMPSGAGQVQLTMTQTVFELPIYSGSVLRRRDAVQVQAAAGQESVNTDLSIPLSKLHSISGSLLARDGHTINGGKVQLLHSDDKEDLAVVNIDREDREFHFPYVPEDDYLLSVPEAKDVTQVEVENAKGATPRSHMEDKTVRTYGSTEQPLKIQTDMTGILVNVPDKKENTPSTPSGTV